MIKIPQKRLNELKNSFNGKRIAIIGDMMLDIYYRGEVKRISPEAPVPIVEVENEFFRFGGAANCALNILSLGGIPEPIGVIGYDSFGTIFTSLLSELHISSKGILVDENRPTTAKTRVIADKQHVVRIDKESKQNLNSDLSLQIFNHLEEIIDSLDGIILQDYNKGVLNESLTQQIISLAQKKNILVTVDPKFHNFFAYKNVTVFKPNRKEAEDVLGIKLKTKDDISQAGKIILEKLNADSVLLTLGSEGIAVFEKGKPEKSMPTKARKVADVSGAGDTVISTLTLALAAGADIIEASYLANYAGGIVCEEVGIVPIEADKLFNTIIQENK
ncbi:MAG TPA: D-glycero-beta-D-manno-heptose-7-phosphate kinase [Ignavibacteriaceae bacterium]|nr:D-glycero-beta-D-manno-heptose-7-phosphate kinase [Ignavibacteriaceae bacterium]